MSFKEKDSYVKLPRVDFRHSAVNITIDLKTKRHNGILLYAGEQQHVAIELFRGRVGVSFDVGNYPVSTMFSFHRVDDGRDHHVEFIVDRKNFTMEVDYSGKRRTIMNEGPNEFLDYYDSLYLGGLPSKVNAHAFKKWHIRDGASFIGKLLKKYPWKFYEFQISRSKINFHNSSVMGFSL